MRTFLLFTSLLLAGCGHSVEPQAPLDDKPPKEAELPANKPEPAEVVKMGINDNIWDAYHDNEVAADLRLGGKVVEFCRPVSEIGKTQDGKYLYVAMTAYTSSLKNESAITCYFPLSEAENLAQVNRHDFLFVQGTCKGKRINPSFWDSLEIVVTDCKVIKSMTLQQFREYAKSNR